MTTVYAMGLYTRSPVTVNAAARVHTQWTHTVLSYNIKLLTAKTCQFTMKCKSNRFIALKLPKNQKCVTEPRV